MTTIGRPDDLMMVEGRSHHHSASLAYPKLQVVPLVLTGLPKGVDFCEWIGD
jgi:hypothetical protein